MRLGEREPYLLLHDLHFLVLGSLTPGKARE